MHRSTRPRLYFVAVVVGAQEQFAPELIVVALLDRFGAQQHGKAQHARHDVHHRVIGRLARVRIALGWITNNAKRGLITCDLDRFDVLCATNRSEMV